MQNIISSIAEQVGLDRQLTEKAVGIMLSLIKSDGDPELVSQLMHALPGADELALEHGGKGGGLLGRVGGALGGGTMAAFGKLTQAGLKPNQIEAVARALVDQVSEQTDEDLLKKIVSSIPGLGQYV